MTASTDRSPAGAAPITVQEYQAADRAVVIEENRRGFTVHATIYGVANALMIAFNLAFAREFLWFPFPLLFWGFGLSMHYLFSIRRIGQEITNRQAKVQRRASQQRAA
jgi:2TM domain